MSGDQHGGHCRIMAMAVPIVVSMRIGAVVVNDRERSRGPPRMFGRTYLRLSGLNTKKPGLRSAVVDNRPGVRLSCG